MRGNEVKKGMIDGPGTLLRVAPSLLLLSLPPLPKKNC